MQLNTNKPYATIYGHHSATYEQEGILFDGGGNPLDREQMQRDDAAENAEYGANDFLAELLNGTPMSRKKIAEVAEKAGFAWFDIENAAAVLNVQRRKQGFGETWLLNN